MKKFFLFSSPIFLFIIPVLAFAQAKITISTAIPGMGTLTSSTPPGAYISGFYNFALGIAGVLALGAIVYGGILYAASMGNPSKQSEGKAWIWSALTGILLLGGAYLVLYTINPNLVNLGLPGLTAISIPAPTKTPTTNSSCGSCNGTCNGTCPGGYYCQVSVSAGNSCLPKSKCQGIFCGGASGGGGAGGSW